MNDLKLPPIGVALAPITPLGALPSIEIPGTVLPPLLSLPPLPPLVSRQLIPARVLVADVPWPFNDKLPGGGRGAVKHYKVLSLDEIKQFPIPPVLDDSILFLWRVGAMVEEAYAVARAWGFVPKSELIWIKARPCKTCEGLGYALKTLGGQIGAKAWCESCEGRGVVAQVGMGRYTRRSTETCLIAVRGKPSNCYPDDKSIKDYFYARRTEHSEKPNRFFEIVEKMYPNGTRVELFARKRRAGWIQYGDELPPEGT